MSKEPAVRHTYHAKKDHLEITIKHYALKKKADRENLIRHLLHHLEKSGLGRSFNLEHRGERTDTSIERPVLLRPPLT
jgi:hypothetical protein